MNSSRLRTFKTNYSSKERKLMQRKSVDVESSIGSEDFINIIISNAVLHI
jgi:hypothetical protein